MRKKNYRGTSSNLQSPSSELQAVRTTRLGASASAGVLGIKTSKQSDTNAKVVDGSQIAVVGSQSAPARYRRLGDRPKKVSMDLTGV